MLQLPTLHSDMLRTVAQQPHAVCLVALAAYLVAGRQGPRPHEACDGLLIVVAEVREDLRRKK